MLQNKYAILPVFLAAGLAGYVLTFSSITYAEDTTGCVGCGGDNDGGDGDHSAPTGPTGPTGPSSPGGSSGSGGSRGFSGGDSHHGNHDNDIDGFTSKRLKDRPLVCVVNNQTYFVTYPYQCGNNFVYTRKGQLVSAPGNMGQPAYSGRRKAVSRQAVRKAPSSRVARGYEAPRYSYNEAPRYNYNNGGYNDRGSCGRGYRFTYEYGCVPRYNFGGGPVVQGGYYGSSAAVAQAVRRASRAGYGNGTGGLYNGNGIVTGPVSVGRVYGNTGPVSVGPVYPRPRYQQPYAYDRGVDVHYGTPIGPYDGY